MNVLDPLAQSFYVEPQSGIYVTSVDLYFYSKDDNLPVTVQLRTMELGLPTENVYPFSEVVIDPKDVNVSDDATIPTRVTFPSPVYLVGERFHCIVLLSNSNQFKVWISRLGEVDITTASGVESDDIVVTKQPLSGGLFKSQNASTWNESPYEDLKFTLYRANFTETTGNINFYNPKLELGNDQIATLIRDPFEMNSKLIRVGLGTTVQDTGLIIGNTISQQNSNATGDYVGSAGSASGTLNIINAGVGYTPASGYYVFTNVSLDAITGSGRDATANIAISNGVAIGATINSGGSGYVIGDVLTANQIGSETLGRNLQLSLVNTSGENELIIDNVQGDFNVGTGSTLQYTNSLGITTVLNSSIGGNVIIPADGITTINDGLHIQVNHKNHGMHAEENSVVISNAISDIKPTKLTTAYDKTSTSSILVDNASDFGTFENVGISSTNPGYVLIGDEIIAYEGTTGTSLLGITREIDQTKSFTYNAGTPVYKYELNGISLRRINLTHTLQDATVSDPIGLDYYNIKLDTSQNGKTDSLPFGQVDRSVGTSFPKLYINDTKSTGGAGVNATQNIQYEIIRPNVQTLVLKETYITSRIRTVSGTSVDGSEDSFVDKGFQEISLNTNNYFDSPRLVCSNVNEDTKLTSLPGGKSLTLNLNLSSSNSYVSPAIDLDRVGMIYISNRVNDRIADYATDDRVSTLDDDPSAFVYATKSIELEVPSTSIKVLVAGYVNNFSDLRALYAIQNDPEETAVYYPFPGYNNLDSIGRVINNSNSDGTSDILVPKTDIVSSNIEELTFRDYEFTIDELPSFRYFSIKLIGSSTNQAYPPILRDLRVIALA